MTWTDGQRTDDDGADDGTDRGRTEDGRRRRRQMWVDGRTEDGGRRRGGQPYTCGLQWVAVGCRGLPWAAVGCRGLPGVGAGCRVLSRIAVGCRHGNIFEPGKSLWTSLEDF
jgi:hypothetical protein